MTITGTLHITPGLMPLHAWREIYRGTTPVLDDAAIPRIEESAAAIARIVGRGEPVYGVNTGFGKLASVRIPDDDLERLQRNIVLSHASGVGEPVEDGDGLFVGDGQRREQPHDGRVAPAQFDDQAAAQALAPDGGGEFRCGRRRIAGGLGDKFHTDHETTSAHVADARVVRGQ